MDILKPQEVVEAAVGTVKRLAAKAITYSWGSEAVSEAEIRSRIYTEMVEAPVQSEEELDGQLPLW
jgi:hypothetical protein